MSSTLAIGEAGTSAARLLPCKEIPVNTLHLHALTDQDEAEVCAFLARRPLHTVFMAGLIRDNGLVSSFNRGTFYGSRNESGALEGVALIGHKTVIEAHSETALERFARLALANPEPHLIRGPQEQIERLLVYAERSGRSPRLVCDELLLHQTAPLEGIECGHDLRPATLADLEQVVSINADMAFAESGVNPLTLAPEGIYFRAMRRIEQGRVWVLAENGRIVFKADVISQTPEAIFLEGVYVHPEARGRGYGFRGMTELGRHLLSRAAALCLVVNQANKQAQALYRKAGYQLHSHYCTIYFQP